MAAGDATVLTAFVTTGLALACVLLGATVFTAVRAGVVVFVLVLTGVLFTTVLLFEGILVTSVFVRAAVLELALANGVLANGVFAGDVLALAAVLEDRVVETTLVLPDLAADCLFFIVDCAAVALLVTSFFAGRAVLRDEEAVVATVLCRVAPALAREAAAFGALALDGAAFLETGFTAATRLRAGATAFFAAGRATALVLALRAGDRSVLLEPALALVDLSVFLTDDIRSALLFCSALETERSPSWSVRRTATLRFPASFERSDLA